MSCLAPHALSVVLILAVASCGGEPGGGVDAPPRLPTVFGGDRPVELQVPDTYDPARRYPLVVVLHGYGATALVQQAYLGFVGAADARDVLVLAPEGTLDSTGKQFWNASDACCDFDPSGVDDVAYLGGLLDAIAAVYSVDAGRVYVLGHSNGAFMAYRLACERADAVAAIMGLAGAATFTDPTRCVPARAVSVLHVHGEGDTAVPYLGGPGPAGTTIPSALESIQRWATFDGCGGAPGPGGELDLDSGLAGSETAIDAVAGCPAGVGVELWTIRGGSHVPTFIQPATSDRFWAWLDAHPRL